MYILLLVQREGKITASKLFHHLFVQLPNFLCLAVKSISKIYGENSMGTVLDHKMQNGISPLQEHLIAINQSKIHKFNFYCHNM